MLGQQRDRGASSRHCDLLDNLLNVGRGIPRDTEGGKNALYGASVVELAYRQDVLEG